MLSARIAPWPFPGDGLSHPEHQGMAAHKAFSEFWVQRHAATPAHRMGGKDVRGWGNHSDVPWWGATGGKSS